MLTKICNICKLVKFFLFFSPQFAACNDNQSDNILIQSKKSENQGFRRGRCRHRGQGRDFSVLVVITWWLYILQYLSYYNSGIILDFDGKVLCSTYFLSSCLIHFELEYSFQPISDVEHHRRSHNISCRLATKPFIYTLILFCPPK